MRFGRTIFALLVALSVALLPIPGAFAHTVSGQPLGLQAADCCSPTQPCEKQAGDCGSLAGCTLKCFNLSGAVGPNASAYLKPAATKMAVVADQSVRAPAAAPPLPPPRV